MEEHKKTKQHRGFAAMDPEKQREIASKGGKTNHARGTAHEFTASPAPAGMGLELKECGHMEKTGSATDAQVLPIRQTVFKLGGILIEAPWS